MSDVKELPPLRLRVLGALRGEPDWPAMTAEGLAAYREAENRRRASRLMRVITGIPDRGAEIRWREVALPDRRLRVRVYRPARADGHLPLVLHVHAGGMVGTAVQSDWLNSHLAARLPSVVVSVEHRLLAPGTPLSCAADDGWDALRHLLEHAASWGIDPGRVAVAGESAGALIVALAAIRARDAGLPLRAQVLANPCLDLTSTMLDHASMTEHAHSPTLSVTQVEAFRRYAVPPGTDPRAVSPLHADDLTGLAPALVVVPTIDPVADHGRRYAERLDAAGTPARLAEHPGATHGLVSMPGLMPQARTARTQLTGFLRDHLTSGER
ncbi:alpha/beta hydrolase [Pseudonocardia acaciae]|uniref:alpha/beta hydrolase n=1 Tax=Pseudonocardia acaciae TaxID=551276 RepID=UPI0006849476|nr:alpha/beta hydrolase [Pseudonocardia acaciae]